MASPLHPDCVAFLKLVEELGRPRFEDMEYAETRTLYAGGRKVLQPPSPEVAEARDLALPSGVPARLYRPMGSAAGEALPCLVFAHGGGWVVGDLDTHDHPARTIANLSGCAVLSVDYRLAPEHRFPAAVEDFGEAVHYAHVNAAALGLDPERLAVGGDSAGGNLAAVAALMARDGTLPPLRFQMLIYPVVEMAQTHGSYARFTSGLPLTDATMRWFRAHYAPEPASWDDWRASPLRASNLAGAAPAFVLTVGHDPLCDEGRDYAARLEREGVRVTHVHAADMLHGVMTMGAIIKPALSYIDMAARALRDAMA
ncbi:alpha/beta hydrolase [Roseococcus sp. SYP-B2431]|uniref:alpha/beta hydrolase n=1 Tax=Roseococcus sp. SYP-B2431 TaxID=2496640 RepID=UPI00103D40D5|nr:alpha/beta hydrolase [Roseococcus sp. SYP-B2431]TCH99580.1 alpha/beta hydrolase [Roseococcus sp. SYP-B2431]